jgi:hypothetical protein
LAFGDLALVADRHLPCCGTEGEPKEVEVWAGRMVGLMGGAPLISGSYRLLPLVAILVRQRHYHAADGIRPLPQVGAHRLAYDLKNDTGRVENTT